MARQGGRRRGGTRLAAVLLILAALGGALWRWAVHNGVRISAFEPGAEDLLDQVLDGGDLSHDRDGAVERMEPDGTTPDAATQVLRVRSVPAATAAVRRGCRAAGLRPPDAMTSGSQPDTVCWGDWRGGEATVTVGATPSGSATVSAYFVHP